MKKRTIIDIYINSKNYFKFSNIDIAIYSIITIFFISFILFFDFRLIEKDFLIESIKHLLPINSTILGFSIAGFSFIYAFPTNVVVKLKTTKAQGYPWSYLRTVLLTYVNVIVPTFLSIVILLIIGALTSFFKNYFVENFDLIHLFFIYLALLVQTWVLISIRAFLFWIYDNADMIGTSTTILHLQEEKKFSDDKIKEMIKHDLDN